jgi:peptidoglycan/xylan/chitin deacetylase (PgdA/CDA1 family)
MSGEGGGSGRLRKFWQVHPGTPNVLSTAGSFSPPVGSRVVEDSVEGYYIDFSVKADSTEWPPHWLPARNRRIHVATAQFGLGCIERYLAGDGDVWLQTAVTVAEELLEDQSPDGGWAHEVAMPHSYWLRPPWLSAMAQGESASLFVRLHTHTGDERYAEAAVLALKPMLVPVAAGGVRAELDGGFFPEEYPTDPASYVLNGAIFALWGCRDVAVGLGDETARELYDEGVDTLANSLGRFDTGFWSLYDLFPHPIPNIASGAYHLLHRTQLEAMQLVSPRPEFAETAARWETYAESQTARTRAFAEKVAFRLAVPRSKRFAHRMPWSHRPEFGELLVLCYHAVSDEWPSRLAVTQEHLREQLSELVDRGYRGHTFSEAIASESDEKRLVVTFDDAYESMLTRALPILEELGLPGTVYVPTNFPASGKPLSWPGIEEWLDTTHRDELKPLDWDQLAELKEHGWEIGSHTLSHPHLTQLDDAQLAVELGESRLEIERRLGACTSIAYPYGDVDERVILAAREAGYAGGAALPDQFYPPRRLAWPRVGIYRADTELRYRAKVSRGMRSLRKTRAWPVVRRALGASRP